MKSNNKKFNKLYAFTLTCIFFAAFGSIFISNELVKIHYETKGSILMISCPFSATMLILIAPIVMLIIVIKLNKSLGKKDSRKVVIVIRCVIAFGLFTVFMLIHPMYKYQLLKSSVVYYDKNYTLYLSNGKSTTAIPVSDICTMEVKENEELYTGKSSSYYYMTLVASVNALTKDSNIVNYPIADLENQDQLEALTGYVKYLRELKYSQLVLNPYIDLDYLSEQRSSNKSHTIYYIPIEGNPLQMRIKWSIKNIYNYDSLPTDNVLKSRN